MKNITEAILAVMKEVKGVDKTMNVGSGESTYKGVSDQLVKETIRPSMIKHGLTLIPKSVEAKTKTDRWEEVGKFGSKQKQSTFTEVNTMYTLLHRSGESLEVCGYGHGVDSQDKGAGKATTYALKYALLYLFLVPTGKLDDADETYSDDVSVPKTKATNNDLPF